MAWKQQEECGWGMRRPDLSPEGAVRPLSSAVCLSNSTSGPYFKWRMGGVELLRGVSRTPKNTLLLESCTKKNNLGQETYGRFHL